MPQEDSVVLQNYATTSDSSGDRWVKDVLQRWQARHALNLTSARVLREEDCMKSDLKEHMVIYVASRSFTQNW